MSRRLTNQWTAWGVAGVVLIALMATVLVPVFRLDATLAYFLIPFAVSFLLFRLLPWRGPATLAVTIPAAALLSLLMWYGGLGVGAAAIVALFLPDQ